MKSLFFYGTMRYMPLLECVLGRDSEALDVRHATLPNYTVHVARDGPYPVLRPSTEGHATGVVVHGLSADDIARLDFYEGGFDYDLTHVRLSDGVAAEVYEPAANVRATSDEWVFEQWKRDWAVLSVAAAEEVMAGFGKLTRTEVAAQFPRIRARAWSRIIAQNPRHGAGVLRGDVDLIKRRRAYSGFFGIEEMTLRHETFSGGLSAPIHRSVFVSSDAALVLPYDPMRDRVLLVEQVRMGPIGRRDPVVWQMEPVAGLIDPGETPDATARREAMEEAGLTFYDLEPAGECYASPGATTEFFHLFVGLCALPDSDARIGGEAEEGEDIRTHVMSFDALFEMAETRRVANVPLAMLTYWLAHHRDRLRTEVAG